MTAVNFPSSPSNGDTLTSGNTTYTYNSTKTRWDAVTTVNGIQLNSLSVGAEAAASGDGGIAYDNTSGEFTYTPPVTGDGLPTQTDNSGKYLTTDGTDASWATVSAGVTIYTNIADLPLSGVPAGAQAYVSATNRLYLWNGTGWYNIALINTAPTITTGGDSSYTLASDGTATVVTLDANDPEGIPITWSYAVTTGALGSTATVSQNNNVFTITPSTLTADAGYFTLTFTASDGVNLATSASEFSLSFAGDWSLATQQAKVQGSNTLSGDAFTRAVSISGDGNLFIVGASGNGSGSINSGAAYIFARSGPTWAEQAILKASDAAQSDLFGYGAAISSDGNTAIVGAVAEDTGGSSAGAAYIFTRSGSTWTEQAKIQASNKGSGDQLGKVVSMSNDGNTVIVGARLEDTGAANAGSAYIFTRSGSTWTQQAQIQPSVTASGGAFGTSVTISDDGNTAFVGAGDYETNNGAGVYVFTRSGSTWTEEVRLQPSTTTLGDNFGISISASSDGNTVISGASLYHTNAISDAGAAFIFTRSGSTWTEEAMIQASDQGVSYQFGLAVSMSNDGNTVIVGAIFDDDGTIANEETGAAYIFTRDGSTWTEQSKLTASDAEKGDQFGYSVAVSGDSLTAIIGTTMEDTGGVSAGAAYVFVAG